MTELNRMPGELLRLTFEASPAAMFMVDGEGVIELANRQCEIMFDYAPGEMGGLSVERLIPSAYAAGTANCATTMAPPRASVSWARDATCAR